MCQCVSSHLLTIYATVDHLLDRTGVADVKHAKAWIKKAWEAFCMCRGPESGDALKMAAYMEDVRRHPAFDLLPRKTLAGPVA